MSTPRFPVAAGLLLLSSVAVAADPTASLVHVSGQGLVRVPPDQVVIELTVTTTDDDLIRVRENSDKDARTTLAAARKHGVDDNGFEVSRLELTLDYNEKLRRQIYQVERDVRLKLNDLKRLDELLSDLVRERSVKVASINFVTSKSRQYEFEARRRAVADAKEKATQLAELNGFELGNARDIRVTRENLAPFAASVIPVVGSAEPHHSRSAERDSTQISKDVPRNTELQFVAFQPRAEEAKAEGRPFALGMIEISANVDIVFELAI
jgi:uncharacterized protein YggE